MGSKNLVTFASGATGNIGKCLLGAIVWIGTKTPQTAGVGIMMPVAPIIIIIILFVFLLTIAFYRVDLYRQYHTRNKREYQL